MVTSSLPRRGFHLRLNLKNDSHNIDLYLSEILLFVVWVELKMEEIAITQSSSFAHS